MSEPSMTEPLVRVTDVHKTFGHGEVNALRGVSMNIEPGEFVAIKGASGSGKSTLLHLLAALDVADRGEIVVAGTNLRQLPNPNRYRRETIGLVFQLHDLLPHLDAQQNVEIPMFGTARSLRERRTAALELLAAVGLGRKEHRRPPEMSGGERQRVAVARALANDPLVLLADEPTGSLDPETVSTVLDLFRRIREERGVTIVMVTHDAAVAGVADRTVTMSAGVITDPG